MKITTLILAIAASTAFVSCTQSSYPTSPRYPYPYPTYPERGRRDAPVIVAPDGAVIDRNGRIIGSAAGMPPGQAKKIFGTRSARPFAPGQRKKWERRERRYDDDGFERGHGYRKHGTHHGDD